MQPIGEENVLKVGAETCSITYHNLVILSPIVHDGKHGKIDDREWHYDDVIMSAMASQITSLTVVYWTVYSDADKKKHQSSASLAFVWGIHRDRWIPRTKGQLRGKCFHLMTSSWFRLTNCRFSMKKPQLIIHLCAMTRNLKWTCGEHVNAVTP